MKYTSKLILICLAFLGTFTHVEAENCSEDYLKMLGMIFESEEETKPKVFLTSQVLMLVGKKLAVKPNATPEHYFEKLKQGFAQVELDIGENQCVRCFSNSVQCVVKNCKAHCMGNPCRRACLKCIESKCETQLLECVGREEIVNPCMWEDEYSRFKSPLEKIFGGEEGASGSG